MKSPTARWLQLTLFAGGLALAGCQTTGTNHYNTNATNTPTTEPSARNNSNTSVTSSNSPDDNSYIGNGAFGENPP
jgi:uncharacterized lipoprotein YajG